MGPGRNQTRDTWICSQTCYQLRYAARYINQVHNHKLVRSLCVFLDVCVYVGTESVHVCLFRSFSFEKGSRQNLTGFENCSSCSFKTKILRCIILRGCIRVNGVGEGYL